MALGREIVKSIWLVQNASPAWRKDGTSTACAAEVAAAIRMAATAKRHMADTFGRGCLQHHINAGTSIGSQPDAVRRRRAGRGAGSGNGSSGLRSASTRAVRSDANLRSFSTFKPNTSLT